VLDLGCGPGLYTNRLATLGHRCRGIDFSPASIRYARNNVPRLEGGAAEYTLEDVRKTDFGTGWDLVMFLFGELNVFTREDAGEILRRIRESARDDGKVLLEVHTLDSLKQATEQYWYSAEKGLFSDGPHLCLGESFWVEDEAVRCDRYYIVDPESGSVRRYGAATQAYTREEYLALLASAGFGRSEFHPSLVGDADPLQPSFEVILASR
jgi:SAM-dependent methyltransferase